MKTLIPSPLLRERMKHLIYSKNMDFKPAIKTVCGEIQIP